MSKKALLIGLQYVSANGRYPPDNPEHPGLRLTGAIKDPDILKSMLTETFSWQDEDIKILTDGDDSEGSAPSATRDAIIDAMRSLVDGVQAGDQRLFFFSGHASQLDEQQQGNEADKKDEVLYPGDVSITQSGDGSWDYEIPEEGSIIRDDDIKKILVDTLPPGASMIMIFDCCHSGTAADLPYNYQDGDLPKMKKNKGFRMTLHHSVHATVNSEGQVEDNHQANAAAADIDPDQMGEATSWSACMDDQVTIDTSEGGIFLKLFRLQIQRGLTSHGDVLHGIAVNFQELTTLRNTKYGQEHVAPKPQLGSLRPCTDLMDESIKLS